MVWLAPPQLVQPVSLLPAGTVKRGDFPSFFLQFAASNNRLKENGEKEEKTEEEKKALPSPPFPCISPLNDSILRGGGERRRDA